MKKKSLKSAQLVKVQQSGRISMKVSANIKPVLFSITASFRAIRTRDYMERMRMALLEEMFTKYFIVLHIQREHRIILTRAQAYAIYETYLKEFTRGNVEADTLMMQLDQKLISLK